MKAPIVAVLLSLASSAPVLAGTFVYVSNAEDGDIGMYTLQADRLHQKPSFWPVRQMSAHSLTAAKKQTSSNRCVPAKPTFLLPCSSVNDHSQWNGSS
jgi:hypothetical protein